MMTPYNPLFPNLSELKDDDLIAKIDELQKRYFTMASYGNMGLASQYHFLLSHYQEELNIRNQKHLQDMMKKMEKNRKRKGGGSSDDAIDVR